MRWSVGPTRAYTCVVAAALLGMLLLWEPRVDEVVQPAAVESRRLTSSTRSDVSAVASYRDEPNGDGGGRRIGEPRADSTDVDGLASTNNIAASTGTAIAPTIGNLLRLRFELARHVGRNDSKSGSSRPSSWPPFVSEVTVADLIDAALNARRALEQGSDAARWYATVPVYGLPCTAADFRHFTRNLATLEGGVERFVVVLNGGDAPREKAVLESLRNFLPAGRFIVYAPPENIGVAAAWNTILRFTFTSVGALPSDAMAVAKGGPRRDVRPTDFCVIANADVYVYRGVMEQWVMSIHEQADVIVGSRLARFAMFAITTFGYTAAGLFDENLWPAYFEDNEFHYRILSMGLGKLFVKFSCNGASDTYDHGYRTNRKLLKGIAFESMLDRADLGQPYVRAKWGMSLPYNYELLLFYKHPFNNRRIPHKKSSILDARYRRCIQTGEGSIEDRSAQALRDQPLALAGTIPRKCKYNVSLTAALEASDGLAANVIPAMPNRKRPPVTPLGRLLSRPGSWRRVAGRVNQSFVLPPSSTGTAVRWVAEFATERTVEQSDLVVTVATGERIARLTCGEKTFRFDPIAGRQKRCEYWDTESGRWRVGASHEGLPIAVRRRGQRMGDDRLPVGTRLRFVHRASWTMLVPPTVSKGYCSKTMFVGDTASVRYPPKANQFCDVWEPRDDANANTSSFDDSARSFDVEEFAGDNGWIGCGAVPWSEEGLFTAEGWGTKG